jgi:hypothetical protein
MTELEKARREVELLHHAINTLKECAAEERRVWHDKHTDIYYSEAINLLDLKRTGADAYLRRLETVGR